MTDQHPNLFIDEQEIALFNEINFELIETVVGQYIIYYPVDVERTQINIYGESTKKVFKDSFEIKALVLYEEPEVTTTQFGQDTIYSIEIYLHKYTINQIKDFKPSEGDYVKFGDVYYEITGINEPQLIYGDPLNRIMTKCTCKVARQDEILAIEKKN